MFARIRSFTFQHRQRFNDFVAPRKPRHRVMRFLLAALGLGVLAVLLVVGLVVGALMLGVTLLVRRLGRRRPATTRAGSIDGEYRVLRKPALSASR